MRIVTKKEQLREIRSELMKGITFIKQEDIEIYSTKHKCYLNKHVGSDLCYLYNALRDLDTLIDGVKVERVT